MKKVGFDIDNASHYKPLMLSNSLKTLCFISALQLFASDIHSDSIIKERIDSLVGDYQVIGGEVYKNEIKLSASEAIEDANVAPSLGVKAISLKARAEDTYSIEFTLPNDAKAKWKMTVGEFTQGDEAVGIDGHTLRLGAFEGSQVGWRKVNFGIISSTQARVVETLSFEEKEGTLLFSQHKVFYEYPIGTSYKVPRKLTLEFVYKLKKL